MTLGEKLRWARHVFGHTQQNIGHQLGYAHPRQRICEIEKGHRNPGPTAKKWIIAYIHHAELIDKTGYSARRPKCGWWNNNPTGIKKRTSDDPGNQVNEQECEQCRHRWIPPA